MIQLYYDSFDEFIYMRRVFALNGFLTWANGGEYDAAQYNDAQIIDRERQGSRIFMTENDIRILWPTIGDIWMTPSGRVLRPQQIDTNEEAFIQYLQDGFRLILRANRPVLFPRIDGIEENTGKEQAQSQPETPRAAPERKVKKGFVRWPKK